MDGAETMCFSATRTVHVSTNVCQRLQAMRSTGSYSSQHSVAAGEVRLWGRRVKPWRWSVRLSPGLGLPLPSSPEGAVCAAGAAP